MKKIFTLTVVLAAALTLSSCDCFKKMAKDPAAIQMLLQQSLQTTSTRRLLSR